MTIKDVAKRAGVSLGTVSNVINGKTNNPELIERVEKAIKELDFRPVASARNLKNTKNNSIALILPNFLQQSFISLLTTIEQELKKWNYNLILKNSQNNPILELQCIDQSLSHGIDGLIIYSINPKKRLIQKLSKENLPIILLNKNTYPSAPFDTISINYKSAFHDAFKLCQENNDFSPGVIMEHSVIDSEELIDIYTQHFNPSDTIKIVDSNQERGFKAAYELLEQDLHTIITSSYPLAQGAKKAAELLGKKDVHFITCKDQNWLEDINSFIGTINISYKDIGQDVVNRMISKLNDPEVAEPLYKEYKATLSPVLPLFTPNVQPIEKSTSLNIYMFDCPAAHALKMLAKVYEQKTGTHIHFSLFDYRNLENLIFRNLPTSNIDCFMSDILWLENLIEDNQLQPLDKIEEISPDYFSNFIGGRMKDYGAYGNHLYGVPFMPGTQILVYQRDLFESPQLKRQFKRMYKKELAPPTTWEDFNLIASFFTRSINDRSPVKFGLSSVKGDNIFTTINFLNRLWDFGGDVFKEEEIVIRTQEALLALNSFCESYKYTDPNRHNTSWDDLVEEFKEGHCAMAIIYDCHAIDMNDYTKSKVAGNIGCSLIPGKNPVLGGWSLCINKSSKHLDQAMNFLMWACSNNVSIPYSLLGGTTLRENYYTSLNLDQIHPWKPLLVDSYQFSRKRILPNTLIHSYTHYDIYNDIMGYVLNQTILGCITKEKALEIMEKLIGQLYTYVQ